MELTILFEYFLKVAVFDVVFFLISGPCLYTRCEWVNQMAFNGFVDLSIMEESSGFCDVFLRVHGTFYGIWMGCDYHVMDFYLAAAN